MPQETLFRAIVEVVLSVFSSFLDWCWFYGWRVTLSIFVTLAVLLTLWITLDDRPLRTLSLIASGIGIPLAGIIWHLFADDRPKE